MPPFAVSRSVAGNAWPTESMTCAIWSNGTKLLMPARASCAELKAAATPMALRFWQGTSTRPPTGSQTRPSRLLSAMELASSACSGVPPSICTSAAAAIEHFHTAALIHDDIADEAELRRGEPCMHCTEGIGLAINAGDLALSLVNGTVVEDPDLDDHTKVRVISELIEMTRRTIEGQALDIGWARDGRYDITPEDYLVMATHKTAHYSGAVPLAVGAIIGGGTAEEVEALRSYGLDTGLAFQIQDDLLNLIGSEESMKKDFRSDITEGKRTLVVVHALSNAAPEARERLIQILSAKEKDPAVLAEAVDIMQATGSIEYARSYAENLTNVAKGRLVQKVGPSPSRELLISMADWFVNRLK